ncbi:M35 family metallo-endopeptidase [Vitiosangium sp. GDMCC 1.1324]|uniref:M35 family metallo-endopeptidase n=1 Tax=Vitiosangium sp. (strain GDMCC 1.1324) TaxID=2138576 RepID=UPI00130D66AF|nr:M35 family metallo-endopeptidase [Vitiosangium sp. GDMCC 1.1324]
MAITWFFGADETSKNTTSTTVTAAMKALQDADNALANPTAGPAAAALATWFGGGIATKSDRIEKLRSNIRTMRACLNSWNVSITSGGADPNTNAACFQPVFITKLGRQEQSWVIIQAVAAKGGSQKVDLPGGDSLMPQDARFAITVYNNFLNMPLDGAHLAVSAHQQDRIETLIHEMSHAIAGTKDQVLANHTAAYGRANAIALVAEDPAKAFDNAENWGLFCASLRQ